MKKYPFKFLNAYDSEDTEIFFGRDEEIEQLYQMVFQSEILLVYGGSGTGKTSLINCGLASRFQAHDWLALNIRRGQNLNQSLREKLRALVGEPVAAGFDLDWLAEDETETLAPAPHSEWATQLGAIYRQYFRPIYLIFDQFEELYILGNAAEQAEFIASVQEILLVEQPVKLIFIIREEYLGHLFEFEKAVPSLLRKKLRIEPMNLDKVRQVIQGASDYAHTNVHLQPGEEGAMVEQIFTKIKGDDKTLSIQLPYLQVFLDKLYLQVSQDESRQADATFTLQALSQIGDIGDVLRDFLEEQALAIQQQLEQHHRSLPEDAVWRMLSPFVTLDGTKEPLSVAAMQERLPDFPSAALQTGLQELENRRILRYEENQGLYEIAHDSLALRIAERRSDEEIALLEIRRLVKSQSSLQAEAREPFSEKQLNFIEPYLDKLGLTRQEMALIEESRRAVAAQKEAEQRQANAEREALLERQRLLERNQKNQRRFLGAMGVVLIGMAFLAFWALGQRRQANQALNRNLQQQAETRAKEYQAFGDSYLDLGKNDYACESYQAALQALANYDSLALYEEIKSKRESLSCNTQ